jgi:hypothetical protein
MISDRNLHLYKGVKKNTRDDNCMKKYKMMFYYIPNYFKIQLNVSTKSIVLITTDVEINYMKRMPRPGEEINFNILSSFYYR